MEKSKPSLHDPTPPRQSPRTPGLRHQQQPPYAPAGEPPSLWRDTSPLRKSLGLLPCPDLGQSHPAFINWGNVEDGSMKVPPEAPGAACRALHARLPCHHCLFLPHSQHHQRDSSTENITAPREAQQAQGRLSRHHGHRRGGPTDTTGGGGPCRHRGHGRGPTDTMGMGGACRHHRHGVQGDPADNTGTGGACRRHRGRGNPVNTTGTRGTCWHDGHGGWGGLRTHGHGGAHNNEGTVGALQTLKTQSIEQAVSAKVPSEPWAHSPPLLAPRGSIHLRGTCAGSFPLRASVPRKWSPGGLTVRGSGTRTFLVLSPPKLSPPISLHTEMATAPCPLSLTSCPWPLLCGNWGLAQALVAPEGKVLQSTRFSGSSHHEEPRHRGLEPPAPWARLWAARGPPGLGPVGWRGSQRSRRAVASMHGAGRLTLRLLSCPFESPTSLIC